MFGIRFFKLPKAKQYGYKPVFYDPEKEELEQRSMQDHTKTNNEYSYKEHIKGSFQKNKSKARNADIRKANIRLIVIIVGLTALALFFLFS
ncbi:MAG TPA: hypothetical protein PKG63_06625 [Bacteroidales bacterium]|jgi:hypothetical protein|nr:hypothetical protein [Bacteroidales bacterium]HOU98604.1 hypothetical protein [Bacteroidales bacterium]